MSDLVFGGRYHVTEKIGTGGMADVFKAQDETLGRTVAVKVMHRQYASDPSFVARFRQEAQSAANLSSPNIVNIYDWGQQEDTYYIVMEYVRGTDLKSLLEQRGPLPATKAADFGAQVCGALTEAHSYDIIHRDIKPQNLILTGGGTVKVTDFGIARAGNTNMTQTGSVLGTAYYLSPEQAQGRPLTPASDLYSLGIVLYELTTGKLPFVGDTPVSTALKQVNEPPVPPRQIDPKIPASLEAVILKAMRKNPAERYQTAKEMKVDLRKVEAGEAVVVTPVAAGAALGVAGAETAMAAGDAADRTTVMSPVGAAPPATGATRPGVPIKKRRSSAWVWVLATLVVLGLLGGFAYAFSGSLFGPPPVPTPNVVGRTLPVAREAILKAGLIVGKVTTSTSDAAASGLVMSQSPPAGANARRGSVVDLVVSTGPPVAAVPDLAGMTEASAIGAIQTSGFTIGKLTRQPDPSVPSGTVISQDPKAGVTARRGSAVNFVVSTGKPVATVPDVTTQARSDAVAALKAAGFAVDVSSEFSDSVAVDVVISQSPVGGTQADKGATVKIVVSKGPKTVRVPDLSNKTQAAAVASMEALGLVNYLVKPQASTTVPVGLVIGTDPPFGSQVKLTDTITIYVSKNTSGTP